MAGRRRHDPVVRPADGRSNADHVMGKDPSRTYCLTNPNDAEGGTDHYVHVLGYTPELVRDSGPSTPSSRGGAPGARVMSKGQILVSCPNEEFLAREAQGQEVADVWESRILRDGGIDDPLRGRAMELRASAGEDR